MLARGCFILTVCPALTLAAHHSPNLVGKWKVASVSVPVTGPAAEKAKAVIMGSKLQLSKNHSFSMKLLVPLTGRWSVMDSSLSLAIDEMDGRRMSEYVAMAKANYENDPSAKHKAVLDELSRPMTFAIGADGNSLTLKPTRGKAGFVLVKDR